MKSITFLLSFVFGIVMVFASFVCGRTYQRIVETRSFPLTMTIHTDPVISVQDCAQGTYSVLYMWHGVPLAVSELKHADPWCTVYKAWNATLVFQSGPVPQLGSVTHQ